MPIVEVKIGQIVTAINKTGKYIGEVTEDRKCIFSKNISGFKASYARGST